MDATFLKQLRAAATEEERQAVLLRMTLSTLPNDLLTAVYTAAIPHWFNAHLLDALLNRESAALYAGLLQLSFVEQAPGKGYAIQERTRRQLLNSLWRSRPDHFRLLSARAAGYCAAQRKTDDSAEWRAEEIYHRLISDPQAGVNGLRRLAAEWANYQYNSYDDIEYAVRLAGEQIEDGRLTGEGAAWTRLWQAKLALLYHQNGRIPTPLSEITITPDTDPTLAAETAQTRGDWLAQTGDKAGMAAAWRQAYDLYNQTENGGLDAYLVAEKLRREGLALPREETPPPTTPPAPPNPDARRLIDNIESAWIQGVLHQALDQSLDLSLARDSGQPANLVYHRPQSLDRPLPGKQRLSRLFEAAGSSLLILGAPGSGKTITLLQLLDELLETARQDGRQPIPLLFNLAAFTNAVPDKKSKTVDFSGWLADQAYNQYRLNRKTTRKELENGRFILLLDGLDEVSIENGRREQCVTAINEFIGRTPCGLVVCSRIADYHILQNRLELAQALVLQPLSNRQIDDFISHSRSRHRAAMQAAIEADWQLREALRSPLLLNLYPQTFTPGQQQVAGETVEARRQSLFAAYIETAFQQPLPEQTTAQPKEKSLHWLSFLAAYLQKAGKTLFFIEELQPTALPQKLIGRYRLFYSFIHGLIISSLFSLFFGAAIGLFTAQVGTLFGGFIGILIGILTGLIGFIIGMVIFLMVGLSTGFFGAVLTWLTTRIKSTWLRAALTWIFSMTMLALIGEFVGVLLTTPILLQGQTGLLPSPESNLIDELLLGLQFGLIVSLFFGLFGTGFSISISLAGIIDTIQLRERVKLTRPDKKRIYRYMIRSFFYGILGGLIFGAVIGMGSGLLITLLASIDFADFSSSTPSIVALLTAGFNFVVKSIIVGGLAASLFFGLFGGMFGWLLAFVDTPPIDKRPRPGAGVHPSLRNALLVLLLSAVFFGLSAYLIGAIIESLEAEIIPGITLFTILPPTFTWFGGLAWCQHWALRYLLHRNGRLPLRLVPWLNEMTDRGLLRRVGGGYIFLHRSLLEHIAALKTTG